MSRFGRTDHDDGDGYTLDMTSVSCFIAHLSEQNQARSTHTLMRAKNTMNDTFTHRTHLLPSYSTRRHKQTLRSSISLLGALNEEYYAASPSPENEVMRYTRTCTFVPLAPFAHDRAHQGTRAGGGGLAGKKAEETSLVVRGT